MSVLTREVVLGYIRGAVQILQGSIEQYDAGETAFYRVMSVELRLLLCDTTRRHDEIFDLALLPRFVPDLRLPVLMANGKWDLAGEQLGLSAWLDQTLNLATGKPRTLRQLIRQVCDQDGGAHVDWRVNTDLTMNTSQAEWMRRIAGVVVEALQKVLE